MKVGHHWTSRLLVMAVLCLTLSAQDETKCDTAIKVKRNTVYEAKAGEQLKIYCNVSVCDNLSPTIQWLKLKTVFQNLNISDRIKTDWTSINNNEGAHVLIFSNIFSNDSGGYRCRNENEMSHTINVTVTDDTATANDNSSPQLWLYVYTAVGIGGFVIIVIVISVLAMRGCKGEPKSNNRSQNQYLDIPMVEQPVHHSNQASPRPSPCGTPSHRTSRKMKSPPAPPQRDNVYDQIEGHRNVPEPDGSSVVYAALNHEPRAGASPRVRTAAEENSEYAAIRVS